MAEHCPRCGRMDLEPLEIEIDETACCQKRVCHQDDYVIDECVVCLELGISSEELDEDLCVIGE